MGRYIKIPSDYDDKAIIKVVVKRLKEEQIGFSEQTATLKEESCGQILPDQDDKAIIKVAVKHLEEEQSDFSEQTSTPKGEGCGQVSYNDEEKKCIVKMETKYLEKGLFDCSEETEENSTFNEGGATQQNLERILRLQKKAIRVIHCLGPRDTCREAFKELKIMTVIALYIQDVILFVDERSLPRVADQLKSNKI